MLHRVVRIVRSEVLKVHASFAIALTFLVLILHKESAVAVIWVSKALLKNLMMITIVLVKHLILIHHMVRE